MGRKGKSYFWHVPPATWYAGSPLALGGNSNTGQDIVATLVDTETAQTARPDIDNFVVERIVGQYMLTKDAPSGEIADEFWHHRVYVAPTNATAIALRSLNTADEAESSFLWHQVDPMPVEYDGDIWGNWQQGSAPRPGATPLMGRFGHVDIRVGRRLEGGEALIWHTQIVPTPASNFFYYVKLWLRLLVREA